MSVGGRLARTIPHPVILDPIVQHTADTNRKQRRALVKAIGHRQFKKLYRKAQA